MSFKMLSFKFAFMFLIGLCSTHATRAESRKSEDLLGFELIDLESLQADLPNSPRPTVACLLDV